MPELGIALAVLLGGAFVLGSILRPELAAMALGVFLFVQSAIIRVPNLPPDLRDLVSRMDEVGLITLVVRFAIPLIVSKDRHLPTPLYALFAFAVVGAGSMLLNGVPPLMGAVGLYLAVKSGLWLFVMSQMRLSSQVLIRYGVIVGALFVTASVLALLQFAGVTLPWEPHLRRSGELAATSIWNQHTVFASAMAVAAGLSVVAFRLPGWRRHGVILAIAAAVGVVLSAVRRLLISLPVAAVALFAALSQADREHAMATLRRMRRGPIVIGLVVALIVVGVAIGPRMVRIAVDTWDEYVVHAAERDRYVLYEGGLALVADSPLYGRGPGTYGSYASVLFDSPAYDELRITLRDGLKMGAPYASLLGEFGILGTGAFLAYVALTIRDLRRRIRNAPPLAAALAAGGLFMLVDMLIESLVHVTFSDSFVSFFVFGGVGCALSPRLAVGAEGRRIDRGSAGTIADLRPPGRRWTSVSVGTSIALFSTMTLAVAALSPPVVVIPNDPRPNIILVLMDDLDIATLDALDGRQPDGSHLPTLEELVGSQGATFANAFTPAPGECAARVSILTGRYLHNHDVLGSGSSPCRAEFQAAGFEESDLPVWLQQSGYRTALVGTYLDGYGVDDLSAREDPVPPGWDRWKAIWGTPSYWRYFLNENGQLSGRGMTERFYLTDVLSRGAAAAINDRDPRPLFMVVTPFAPRDPLLVERDGGNSPVSAPRHAGMYDGAGLPMADTGLPDDLGDKPAFVQMAAERQQSDVEAAANLRAEALADEEGRLESLAAVEDMVRGIVASLDAAGELENSYLILTANQGYHLGEQWLLPGGSGTPYDVDVRVPLLVRGPGVLAGSTPSELVELTDLTATIVDIADLQDVPQLDGRSLIPLLHGEPVSWRNAVLVEHPALDDSGVPAYQAIRTDTHTYVEWADGSRELYDVDVDPHEFDNRYTSSDPTVRQLARRLKSLSECGTADGPSCD